MATIFLKKFMRPISIKTATFSTCISAALISALLMTMPPAVRAYGTDQCAGDRFGSDLVCTAGDVSITGIAVAPGTPTKCIGGSTFTADLDVTINFATPDRWDVGIFLSNDGNDPQDTTASGGAATCSVGILPTSFPFLDLDPNGGLDTCGDGNGTINGGAGSGVVRLNDVPVQCQAIGDSGGNLYIPFVVSWDNQSSPSGADCTSIADPVPNTVSKCNAPDISNPVEVQYGTVNAVVLPAISKTDGVTAVDPGDSISYSVVITNTTGQPLSGALFTDPATANVNVNALSCSSAGGATCPATSITAMQGAGITIPDMPIASSVTFTIDATVSDPVSPSHASTISNTATVTVQGESNSATDVDSINGAVFSDLSTSTKDVVDLNGGEADPGDTLRYTITLIESEGNPVIGADVTDDIPAGVSNFTVVSIPSGASDSSTGAGTGANGTGYLDISGIDVAASGSQIIEFDVTIPLGTPAGTLIDNTATISNPGGVGATPVAPTVPVSPSAVPVTDNKQLYLNSTAPNTLSRSQPAGIPASVTLSNSSATWNGNSPVALQLDNTIASASASLYLSAGTSQARQLEARMYCSSSPSAYVTSGVYALGTIPTTPTLYTFNLTTTVGGFSYPATCPSGNYWVLQATNPTNKAVTVWPVSGGNYSRLNLDSSNVIYVENIFFYDAPYPGGALVTTATPGSTIYVRSVISDPFGSFDVTAADIVINDPNGDPVLSPSPDAMSEVNDSGAATKTYEYAYTLPAAPVAGNYSVRVTGYEGNEGLVDDDLVSAFSVESLDLEVTKSADTTTPAELGNVVYTLTVNNLDAALTATGVQVTDLLPAGLSYVSDTAPAPTTYDSATGLWDIGAIAPSTSVAMTLTAQTQFGTAGSTITNSAALTAYDQYDDNTANNTTSVDVTPVATPSLTIVKSSSLAAANPGDTITYSITVINAGSTAAHAVELEDDMSHYTSFGVDTYGAGTHFNFIDLAPLTGLTPGAATFSQDDGADGYSYTPSSGAGGAPVGFDANVSDWRLPFSGTMASGTQFTLEYQTVVK